MMRFYTRSDPRGLFPYLPGESGLDHNRLAHFWRPVIDMTDSETTSIRLRMFAPLAADLAKGEVRWPWCSMIGVPGLRHQVLRHAGLPEYDCREPEGLTPNLRTPQWQRLLEAIARFDGLDYSVRSLVLFQLAQLSYVQAALRLAGEVNPSGEPGHDRYVYEVARLNARLPGRLARAVELFDALAGHSDPMIAVAARFQGIGQTLRGGQGDVSPAERFVDGAPESGLDGWYGTLIRSRFHRAVALLRWRQRDHAGMTRAMETAWRLNGQLHLDPEEPLVALENTRYLLELRIQATGEGMAELAQLDPYCVEARLMIGDGHFGRGDLAAAAGWYCRAGELGTGSGAVGWYRAGQCFDLLGETGSAVNAMGRCLELDHTAIEPREFLRSVQHLAPVAAL